MHKAVIAVASTVVAPLAVAGCANAPARCDRECLVQLTDDYVAALAANDASLVPIADDALLVENLQRKSFSAGLWRDATGGATRFSIHVPDEERQTAGWMGMMERAGSPVLVAIRLKLEDGEIVEAEHMSTAVNSENLERLQVPRSGLVGELPEASRLNHRNLMLIGGTYYDAVDDNDGSLMPFAADCSRHENGGIAAGREAGAGPINFEGVPIARDCAGQLSSNVMAYIERIDNRRIFAADPVTGLVMGFALFRHRMDFEPYAVAALDGSTVMYAPDRFDFDPFDLPTAHIFKVGPDAKVHEIEAMGFKAAYGSPTGWE